MKGNRLRDRRRDRGLTQTQLADLAHLHRASITRYEAGDLPTLTHAQAIAAVLGTTVDALWPAQEKMDR